MRTRLRVGMLVALAAALAAPDFNPIHAQRREAPPAGQTQPRTGPKQGEAEPRPKPKEGTPRSDKAPAERQPPQRKPSPSRGAWRPPTRPGAVVFVGGYFYDPFFGPYPWWPRDAYRHAYYPLFDNRGEIRLFVTPPNTAAWVDGYYAGVVDDFDGFFQRLPLPPGGHEITLFLEGYQTVRERLFLQPGSTFKLHHTMMPLAPGRVSEPPTVSPPLPPPPTGSFALPRSSSPFPSPSQAAAATPQAPQGTLTLRVQPSGSTVLVDGERWMSSDNERFVLDLAAGPHQITASKDGYQSLTMPVQIYDGETTPVNVSLLGR